MAAVTKFPHLQLQYSGAFKPIFHGGPSENPEVKANKSDPSTHAGALRGALKNVESRRQQLELNRGTELPQVPADTGFLIRIPHGNDVDQMAHELELELVAETPDGFMLVSTEDLAFGKIEAVLAKFEAEKGGSIAAQALQIYDDPADNSRLEQILGEDVFGIWPFPEKKLYIFDLSFQTGTSLKSIKLPIIRKRKAETEEQFASRKREARDSAYEKASNEWDEAAESQFEDLSSYIKHYEGEALTGVVSEPSSETGNYVTFPDGFQCRVKMSGEGFRDVIFNFPHLFEVTIPEDIEQPWSIPTDEIPTELEVLVPERSAPAVCVIDSGIQEQHRLLEPAVDSETSHCYLPGREPNEVQDEVSPGGHGTPVAGAVIYHRSVTAEGSVQPVCWIQNARILDQDNKMPEVLLPARTIQQIVERFNSGHRRTKIFNHSINTSASCRLKRMSAWATKIDELSHSKDVLFIQSAGNISRDHICRHLEEGREYPDYLTSQGMSRIANPAQSLQAITVGSICEEVYSERDRKSFADYSDAPSSFSRTGFGLWNCVKPDVVEVGGDVSRSIEGTPKLFPEPSLAPELVKSTLHGQPAVSRDDIGTSFAAPKVAHLAAHLQTMFPDSSPLLYRGLIVQSARWPNWADNETNKDKVLKQVGFGVPSLQRATDNDIYRATLVTPDSVEIRSKQFHLYSVEIPDDIRATGIDHTIRLEVTLSYSSAPRRTRSSRSGYLETWLDWRSTNRGEPVENFRDRMMGNKCRKYHGLPWTLHFQKQHGKAEETRRENGTVQKDWADFPGHELPETLGIAVRAHNGWNHREGEGLAKYCLVVSLESIKQELPIYEHIESAVQVETEVRDEIRA